MEKYNVELDMNNENSLSIMIGMIEKRSEILEVGCANGRMTKYMLRVTMVWSDLQ